MDEQRRGVILADCIERLQAGETVAGCLAHYGDEAVALAPLLSAAARLQRVSVYRLTADQRGQAKAALREAMLGQNRRSIRPDTTVPWRFRLALPGSLRGLALAGMLAIALFAVVTITAVAASQPGDAAYPIRVMVERAPVLLKTTSAAKTTTELHIADRRLADVDRYLAATGRLENNAVAALLGGDQAAADRAVLMSEGERATVAARIEAHARTLAYMAETASGPQTRESLHEAAEHALAIATRLQLGPRQPEALPGGQPTGWPPPTPTPTAALPAATVSPTGPAQRTPTGTPVTHGVGPEPRATAPTPNRKATPLAPAAPLQPMERPRVTAVSPQATATSHAQRGPVATPTQAPIPGGNPTAEPGRPSEPGGNPTAEPGGPGEPGGNPTDAPGGPGEPSGNPTAEPGGPGEPGGNPTDAPEGAGSPGL